MSLLVKNNPESCLGTLSLLMYQEKQIYIHFVSGIISCYAGGTYCSLGVMHRTLMLQVLPASVHCTIVNAFNGPVHLKPFRPGQ